MKLKDYLHLYYGCPCLFRFGPTGAWKEGSVKEIALQRVNNNTDYELKLILRPLSSMTEEEKKEFIHVGDGVNVYIDAIDELLMYDAERTRWLLSKHFDLFGLIDAGLAIGKTAIDVPTL